MMAIRQGLLALASAAGCRDNPIDPQATNLTLEMQQLAGRVAGTAFLSRLDLESRGIVETFTEKGIKLNRLKKK